MKGQRAGGTVVLLLGVGLGMLAIIFALQKVPLILSGVKAGGRVVSVDETGRSSRRYGVVEFRDLSGTARTIPTSSPGHHVGDLVQVLYNPSRPAQAFEHSFATTWAALIALPLLSAFLIAGGRKISGKGTRPMKRRSR